MRDGWHVADRPNAWSGRASISLLPIPEKDQEQSQEQHRADRWESLVFRKQPTEIHRRHRAGAMPPSRMNEHGNDQAEDAQREGATRKAMRQQDPPDTSTRLQVRIGPQQGQKTAADRNGCGCNGNDKGNCIERIHVASCAT